MSATHRRRSSTGSSRSRTSLLFASRPAKCPTRTQFLTFLHHAGIVFWQDGLFQNQVILDQGWVLEAIYTVFHRQHCLKTLRDRQGRFTRRDLAMMIWDREGYSEDEQKLFLSFMLSSGICFKIRPHRKMSRRNMSPPTICPRYGTLLTAWIAGARPRRMRNAASTMSPCHLP